MQKFPTLISIAGLVAGFVILFGISMLAATHLPSPILISKSPQGVFISERAFQHLEKIVSLGPRITGSYANDVSAVELLLKEIDYIKQIAHPFRKITVDVQKASGVVTQVRYANTVYHQLTNIAVRIENKNSTDVNSECLLINAHFDSVLASPGNKKFNALF